MPTSHFRETQMKEVSCLNPCVGSKEKAAKKQQREKIFPFKMQFAWNVHAKGTICVLICVADVLRGFLQCLQCFGGEQAGRCGLQSISRTRLTCYPVSLSLDVLLIF